MKRVRPSRIVDSIAVIASVVLIAWAFGESPTQPAPSQQNTATTAAEVEEELDGSEPERGLVNGVPFGESEAEELIERQNWFANKRRDNRKLLPARAWQRAQAEADKLVSPLGLETTPLQWSSIGPKAIDPPAFSWVYGGSTPYSGRVSAIAPHPTNSSVAYLGAAQGGVWRTTDSGATWAQIFDTAPSSASSSVGAVALDPSSPDTIYVGTGEANFNTDGYLGTGLYRSTNGGQSWGKLGGTAFDGCSISSIVVKSGEPSTVVVGVTSPNVWRDTACTTGSRFGIYRTINGGANWTRVLAAHATKVVAAPNNPAVLYAGAYDGGVYKSVNSGGSWTKLTSASFPASPFGRVEITAVAAAGLGQQQTLYAAFAAHEQKWILKGVYRSNDGGASWAKLNASDFCNGQCYYDLTLAANPANANQVVAGGIYLSRFLSNAQSYFGYADPGTTGCPMSAANNVATKCIHVDFHALAFDAAGRLWVGSDGGVWRTSNFGSAVPTFTNLNTQLSNIQFYPGIAGSISAPPLLGGAQDNGSSRYSGAQNWTLVEGGDGGYQAVVANRTVQISTWQQGRVHRIVNGTYCANDENPGPAEVGDRTKVAFIPPLVASPANTNTVYAGTYRVYRTTNANAGCGLMAWQAISQYFTTTAGNDLLTAIAPASDGSTIYASTASGRVYVTTGGSTTWANRSTGLPGREISDFWVSPTAAGTAYATVVGFDATGRHIYRTTDFGVNWQTISGNLINSPANAVAVDTTTTPATIYVGTDNGIFWSNDGGAVWQNTSIGLPRVVVTDLLIDKTAKKMIAATYGRGMWTAPLIGATTPPSGPAHDAFATARTISGVPYTDAGVVTANATAQSGENLDPTCTEFIGKTVWYRYAPTTTSTVIADTIGSNFDTVIVAYQGTSLAGLTQITCDDDGAGAASGPSKTASLKLTAGQTYYFQVGGWSQTSGGTPASGTLTFHLTAGGPVNNDFATAAVAGSLPYTATPVSNASATNEATEDRDPSCADFVGNTLWYRYVPGSTTTVTVDTIGSSFDTVLTAFQGTSLAALSEVGCDDDGGGAGGPSRIGSLTLTAGQTYYFQVGGWIATLNGAAATGTVNFRITSAGPTSDMFAGAITISALPYTDTGRSTVNATTEAGEDVDPSCTDFIGKTVWYRFVVGSSGTFTADTLGSNFDTVIVVYQGTTLGGLSEVACDDDGGGAAGGPSKITSFSVSAGLTYYVQVGGWRSSVGTPASGSLNFKLVAP